MALIPWKPFNALDKFFEDEDWLWPAFPLRSTLPAMDIYETDKELVAEINLPGVDPEKIDISIKDNLLSVSAKTEEKKEEKEKGYWRKEIKSGLFERVVHLPVAVKEDKIEATYDKGVLKIVMPKAEAKPTSKIKVKVKESK